MYSLIYIQPDGRVSGIRRADGATIPIAEGNADYQAFLEWNREQAIPLDLNSISQDDVDRYEANKLRLEQKARAMIDNLPSWVKVSTAVDNIANLADAKIYLKKLSRVVYWLARDSEK